MVSMSVSGNNLMKSLVLLLTYINFFFYVSFFFAAGGPISAVSDPHSTKHCVLCLLGTQ